MTDNDTATHLFRSWLGIQYATAERFRRPVLLPFDPNRAYDQKGPAPMQAGDISWLEADNGLSEDYLNLNVWAPSDALFPVVVYIFGGGFEVGANTQTTSNAAGLAATCGGRAGRARYGDVRHRRPVTPQPQRRASSRDTFVCDTLLDFVAGKHDRLWQTVTTEPTFHDIGNPSYDPTAHAAEVLRTFAGIERT